MKKILPDQIVVFWSKGKGAGAGDWADPNRKKMLYFKIISLLKSKCLELKLLW